jgi:protein TonB
MTVSNATQNAPAYELKSELARICLPSTRKDPNRKLAWVNSICILFLLIGIVGSKPATVQIKAPPPLEEVIPTIIEPPPPPPTRIEAQSEPKPNDAEKNETPQVVAVTLDTPAINFSVPTVGNLLVPSALSQAPAIALAVRPLTPLRTRILATGSGGDRPQPKYPEIAKQLGQQGTVLLSISVDQTGTITDIQIKESSGSVILDKSTLDWVKRHWILQAGTYEAPIRYVLE